MNEIKNKIMMDLENVVVYCPTEELAEAVLKKAHDMGYKWRDGYSFLDFTYWEAYKEDTCYLIKDGQYCDLDWYKDNGYKIISAKEFLNKELKV